MAIFPMMADAVPEEHLLMPFLRLQVVDEFYFLALMASSDVDQKILGRLAREAEEDHPFLASMLFKVLGLSVLLSKKLVRARRLRRLDTTRDTKSLQLYHRIIWLSREGLVITEQYILPMADEKYRELRVLATKLQASFYHVFVLFHNRSNINQASIPSYRTTTNIKARQSSLRATPDSLQGGPVQPNLPPGLAPISIPNPTTTFLLPPSDFVPMASTCFAQAAALAEQFLTGSHPLRASVKVEYAAYLFDCVHDSEASRRLAKSSLHDVYMDEHGMDDDMFEDTAKLVVILDKMARRGLSTNQVSSGSAGRASAATTPSTPRAPFATGAHPSLPSPAELQTPEKCTAEVQRSAESKRRSGSKRSPENIRSPESKRSPASKRSAESSKRSPETIRSPDSKRRSETIRSPEAKRTPEAKRNSSDRPGSRDKRPGEQRSARAEERRTMSNSTESKSTKDPRSPTQQSRATRIPVTSDKRSGSNPKGAGERRSSRRQTQTRS